jgi:integrase
MGSIEKYDTAAGARYRVRYRKPDHTQGAKRGFVRKRDAEDFLAGVTVSKSTGSYVDPSRSKILLGDWLDQWMDGRADLQPTSRERARGIIETHIKPKLGAHPIGSLDHEMIQAWAASLSKESGQGAWSVRKIVNVLSGSLQKAVKSGRLPVNHAHGLDLPKLNSPAKRYLSHAQVLALADAIDQLGRGMYLGKRNGYGLLVKVMAYCGPRWGEASGLRVKDVDLKRGRLEIQHTVVEVDGNQIHGVPKDYEARSIPVPATLLADLKEWIVGRAGDDPLFPAARGGWLRGRVFRRGWLTDAATEVGVAGLTPHELRHTAASLAISAGANVKAVQKMLGHASAAVTLDVYADLFDEDLDAVSFALDQAIAEAIVSKPRPDAQSDAA